MNWGVASLIDRSFLMQCSHCGTYRTKNKIKRAFISHVDTLNDPVSLHFTQNKIKTKQTEDRIRNNQVMKKMKKTAQ